MQGEPLVHTGFGCDDLLRHGITLDEIDARLVGIDGSVAFRLHEERVARQGEGSLVRTIDQASLPSRVDGVDAIGSGGEK